MGFQAGDVNLYRFVGNDPTNATDPSGLDPMNFNPGPVGPDKGSALLSPLPDPPASRERLGKWDFKMKPMSSKENPLRNAAGMRGSITFTPDPKLAPQTKSIRLVQTWRVIDGNGFVKFFDPKDPDKMGEVNKVTTPEHARSVGLVARVIEPGWRVDYRPRDLEKVAQVTPYYQAHSPTPDRDTYPGYNVMGKPPKEASLGDMPSGFGVDSRFEFETTAVDTETGQLLGTIRWGFTIRASKTDPDLFLAEPFEPVESRFPSASSQAAIDLFLRYYKAKW